MSRYLQGKYIVKNPKKYIGDHTNVIYRSSWELKFLSWCDNDPRVVAFASEELAIPYVSPIDNRYHRYFVDMLVKTKCSDGTIKTYLVEIKPKKQTKPPEVQKRVTKRYISEVATYGVNSAKWKAAEEYCLDRGWEFKIITEDHLGL